MGTPAVTKEDLITVLARHAELSVRFGLSEVVIQHESGREHRFMHVKPGIDKARIKWRQMLKAELESEISRMLVEWCWVVKTIEQYEGLLDFTLFSKDEKARAYAFASVDDKNDRPEIEVIRSGF